MSLSPASQAAGTAAVVSGSWTTVEVDLGSQAVWRGTFQITDAAITPETAVVVLQGAGPYTNKGTLADEAEMDNVWCVASAGDGVATVYWRALEDHMVLGKFRFVYGVA